MLSIQETELFFNQELVGARAAFYEMFDAEDEEQRIMRDGLYERFVRSFRNVSRPYGFEPIPVDEPDEEGGEP